MARANVLSIFEVDRIVIRWAAESNCYHVVFVGGGDTVTINAWNDHGEGVAAEIVVESYAPMPAPEDKLVPGVDTEEV